MYLRQIVYGLVLTTVFLSMYMFPMDNRAKTLFHSARGNEEEGCLCEDLIKATSEAVKSSNFDKFDATPCGDSQCQWSAAMLVEDGIVKRFLEETGKEKPENSIGDAQRFLVYSLFIKKYRKLDKTYQFDREKLIKDYRFKKRVADNLYKDAQKWMERNTLNYMNRYRTKDQKAPIPTFLSYKILLDELLSQFIVRVQNESGDIKKMLYTKSDGVFVSVSPKTIDSVKLKNPIIVFEGETEERELDGSESLENFDIRDVILANGASYWQYPKEKQKDICCDEQLKPIFAEYQKYLDMAKKGMSQDDKSIFYLNHVSPGTIAQVFGLNTKG